MANILRDFPKKLNNNMICNVTSKLVDRKNTEDKIKLAFLADLNF